MGGTMLAGKALTRCSRRKAKSWKRRRTTMGLGGKVERFVWV
jgi:hypothetical protein